MKVIKVEKKTERYIIVIEGENNFSHSGDIYCSPILADLDSENKERGQVLFL